MKITLDLTDREVQQLREIADESPLVHRPTGESRHRVIVKVLDALPITESEAVCRPGSDSSPPTPTRSQEMGGGFRITAYTPRGVSMLEALENVLGKRQ